jgi:hypothetical protein
LITKERGRLEQQESLKLTFPFVRSTVSPLHHLNKIIMRGLGLATVALAALVASCAADEDSITAPPQGESTVYEVPEQMVSRREVIQTGTRDQLREGWGEPPTPETAPITLVGEISTALRNNSMIDEITMSHHGDEGYVLGFRTTAGNSHILIVWPDNYLWQLDDGEFHVASSGYGLEEEGSALYASSEIIIQVLLATRTVEGRP